MEGNEGIFSRVMTDSEFRSTAHEHLAREIFDRVREGQGQLYPNPSDPTANSREHDISAL